MLKKRGWEKKNNYIKSEYEKSNFIKSKYEESTSYLKIMYHVQLFSTLYIGQIINVLFVIINYLFEDNF